MKSEWLDKILSDQHSGFKRLRYGFLFVLRHRAFWLRALLCWSVGISIILFQDSPQYDLRFQMRGVQQTSPEIILIQITEEDWSSLIERHQNILRPLKEISNLSDSFFWNPRVWSQLLSDLLKLEPRVLGVSFFFGDYVQLPTLSSNQREIFFNPKIVWAAEMDSSERLVMPAFSARSNSNIGIKILKLDEDGVLRRYGSPFFEIDHFASQLVRIAHPQKNFFIPKTNQLINYAGPENTFQSFDLKDVLSHKIDPSIFKNKIIIIGSSSGSFDLMQTPLGPMSRAEILANICDNILSNKSIDHFHRLFYIAILFLLEIAALWILGTYPQTVALVVLFWLTTLFASLSAWVFDARYFWIPVLAPVAQISVTYIIFLSYHLSLGERRNWRLQEEQRYLSEIERLKSNFVSMMSHDLKTPIAKIQAIIDRLLAKSLDLELNADLKSLRRFSDELHRYIRSILQISKVEAKDFRLNKEVTDINENILRVLARLSPLAQEKNIRLITKLEPIFSLEVDITLIEEVIANLLENAIQYTAIGGKIELSSQDDGQNVKVMIEDNGVGISEAEQKQIWGKFIRGQQSQMNVQGSGLGLYLVKYFVELHHGKVFLESKFGCGTKVGFSLPVQEPDTRS
jgi:two-component system phosphate regulon sensor histidine kinase PhoR